MLMLAVRAFIAKAFLCQLWKHFARLPFSMIIDACLSLLSIYFRSKYGVAHDSHPSASSLFAIRRRAISFVCSMRFSFSASSRSSMSLFCSSSAPLPSRIAFRALSSSSRIAATSRIAAFVSSFCASSCCAKLIVLSSA